MRSQIEMDQRLDWACKQIYKMQERIAFLESKQQPVNAVAQPQTFAVATKELTGETL